MSPVPAHLTAAAAALDRYGAFFQFGDVSGSDITGWTGKRYQGQGEWNHVVAAGHELYAWTGPTRESVVANRVRALGPFTDAAPAKTISKRQVSTRLSNNLPVSLTFIAINLLLAVGWFFKASAWSASVPPATPLAADLETLRQTLLTMHWIAYLLISLPIAALGLVGGGFIGNACVRWYRVSSFEGGSGYFVIGLALLGAVVGLITGLVTSGVLAPQNGESVMGFLVPLPARPGRKFLEWSDWGPRPPAPHPAWPDTKPSYRFRVQKIAEPPPGPTAEEIQAQHAAEEQATISRPSSEQSSSSPVFARKAGP